MDCQALFAALTDLLEGSLDPEQQEMALDHLASCPQCDRVLHQTREVTRLVAEHGHTALDAGRRQQLLRRILGSVN
jgi:anti-sigma factor RsiW